MTFDLAMEIRLHKSQLVPFRILLSICIYDCDLPMPQSEPHNDPEPPMTQHEQVLEGAPRRPSLIKIPTNKALVTCYDEGISKLSDTDTPEIDPDLPSPRHLHRRRSLLSPLESPMKKPGESVTFSSSQKSPEEMSPAQTAHLRELERSRRPDDDIKVILNRQESEAAAKRKEENRRDIMEPEEERHILRGGWMHRSRASCELLRDHRYKNVGGD
jgi:hypothetical protein